MIWTDPTIQDNSSWNLLINLNAKRNNCTLKLNNVLNSQLMEIFTNQQFLVFECTQFSLCIESISGKLENIGYTDNQF